MLSQIQERDAALRHEIAERRRAEEEVARVHQQLMDASRAAGMAEVATDVLHNVGNVLNSVNVSATIISEKLGTARTANLARAAQLIREKNGTVAQYLSDDPKGQLLPGYLVDATDQLARDQSEALSELQLLTQNIEHIKDIVAMQQSYARVSGLLEPMPMDVLIEDAIRMNAGALERHQVGLVRNFSDVPPAIVDKPKVLQILVNLLRNAKYAMDEGGTGEKRITVRLRQESDAMLAIDISDTGAGILAENLTRVFSHGFTTRRDGHGFGLHSAAIAAKEMGGSLTVTSAGLNRGATFTLLLPAAPGADSSTAEATTAQFHA
jgi:C4-dicarboxylate-specific signal transduction histidine kinase